MTPESSVAFRSRATRTDRKSTRLNSSHSQISYAVFCLKKKKNPADILEYAEHHRALPLAHEIAQVFRIPEEDEHRRLENLASCDLMSHHDSPRSAGRGYVCR